MSQRTVSRRVLLAQFVALGLLASPALFAQNLQPIHRISITNIGPQAVSEALVRANIRIKEGDSYNRASIDDDVRNLYATGYFYTIRVGEERTVDGVDLVYVLQAKPKLSDIIFVGNKKFSNAKLTKKLTSRIGEPLDERKLFADAEEFKKMYQKSGYPQTQVKYVVNIDERVGRGSATFEVTEMPKVRVTDVYFEGAYAYTQRELRKKLKTRRHWMFSWLTQSGKLKDEQLEDDKDRLNEFYRNAGYIDFELKDVKYIYEKPNRLILHFVVAEGTRYRVGTVSFKNVSLFDTNAISRKLKMTAGTVFTPGGLSKDVETIQDFYGTKGYIDTRVIARKSPNTQTGNMDLIYELEEGDQSYIEKIDIKGNIHTKDKVLRRELAVAPGEIFDMVKVKLSKARLEGLHYFDRVEAQPEPTDVPNRKNLLVSVNEVNTGNLTLGAGFSSVDSVLGFVEVSQANFDLFKPPQFIGGGQKMRLRASLGNVRREYEASFTEPWFLGRKLAFSVDLYHRELNFVSLNDLFNERQTGARLGLTRALGSDFLIGGVSYTIERLGIINVNTNAPQVIRDEAGYSTVSKVGAFLAYDTRNNNTLPSAGQRSELRTEFAGGPFGGDRDFYKVEAATHWYFPGLGNGHVFEFIGRAGAVEKHGDSTRVSYFDRYFLGGIDTLRGYRYRAVGPRDPLSSNEPLGGNTYWFGSMEYSIPIIDFLRVAAFYDIGMVYPGSFSFRRGSTRAYNDNYGAGIRLNIPRLGPLRLDYGIPIHADPENRSSGRFQFSVGYTREF